MFGYLSGKMIDLFNSLGGSSKLSDKDISKAAETVQDALIGADVPLKIVKELSDAVSFELKDVQTKSSVKLVDRVQTILFKKLEALLGGSEGGVVFDFKSKSTILVAGLQGAGKTTSIAKIATFLQKNNNASKILVTSLDFVRPAAVDQLRILASKVGVDFVEPVFGDYSATISKSQQMFKSGDYQFLIVDTPGRLHVDSGLMTELQNIVVTLQPEYKLLVIDSMIGQESLKVARSFEDVLDISGAILSKSDSDSKGGVALSLFSEVKKPVLFLGTGERAVDFERFIPSRIAARMLGSGDIQTLVEKIDKQISAESRKNSEDISKRFLAGEFTFSDFLAQMEMMSSFGSLQKIVSYVPGFGKISQEQVLQAEKEMKKLRAIICSMTEKERNFPSILNLSRKQRIAKGAGVSEADVNQLLNKFEECKRFAKLMKGGNWKNLF